MTTATTAILSLYHSIGNNKKDRLMAGARKTVRAPEETSSGTLIVSITDTWYN